MAAAGTISFWADQGRIPLSIRPMRTSILRVAFIQFPRRSSRGGPSILEQTRPPPRSLLEPCRFKRRQPAHQQLLADTTLTMVAMARFSLARPGPHLTSTLYR